MKLKLTKKGKIVLFVILGIVVLGSGGYLLWRVLQEDTVAPEDSEARPPGNVGPKAGLPCDGILVDLGHATHLRNPEYKLGQWVCGKNCMSTKKEGKYSDAEVCPPTRSFSIDNNLPEDFVEGIYSIEGLVGRGHYQAQGQTNEKFKLSINKLPNDEPLVATSGVNKILYPSSTGDYWEGSNSLGKFHLLEDSNSNVVMSHTYTCSGSKTAESVHLYKLCLTKVNICDGGNWVNKPTGTYEYGTNLNPVTVKNTDTDGLGEATVTLNGEDVVKCGNIIGATCYTTKGDNIELLIGPGQQYIGSGDYDLTIAWKDGKGIGGDNCTLSTNFTVLEEDEPEPTCGDGTLDEGEECEQGDPEGYFCTWSECNQDTCRCPDEPEPSCGDGILEETEECELGNPTGYTCTWEECNQDTCLCPEVQENPDWTIVKEGTAECIVEDETTYAKGTYSITVTNVGGAQGSIDKIVDQVDLKVREEYLNDISATGTYDSSLITWDLEGEEETFDPEASQTFTYYLKIPQDSYGRYENTATAYPTQGDNFTADKYLDLECDVTEEAEEETTTVPETGIFDNVLAKVVSGILLILLGLNWGSITNLILKLNYSRKEYLSDRRMKKFEEKIRKE